MSKAEKPEAAAGAPPGKSRKRILIIAVPVLLAATVAGLWFGGILPPLLGRGESHAAAQGEASGHGGAKPGETGVGREAGKDSGKEAGHPPIFVEMPEIIANLNAGPRRAAYVKVRPRLEVASEKDEAPIRASMPRLLDMFQTYLREMRPEELRGSAGMYRLREELLARANAAAAPARVTDILFPEILIQ